MLFMDAASCPRREDRGAVVKALPPTIEVPDLHDRFRKLRTTAFAQPESYFHRYATLSDTEAEATARGIWKRINEPNLEENVLPTRGRAQLIEDLVLLGEGEDWSQKPEEERPRCATCGKPLWARGEQTRWIQTTGGEAVKLRRSYGTCPACGVGFFPPG